MSIVRRIWNWLLDGAAGAHGYTAHPPEKPKPRCTLCGGEHYPETIHIGQGLTAQACPNIILPCAEYWAQIPRSLYGKTIDELIREARPDWAKAKVSPVVIVTGAQGDEPLLKGELIREIVASRPDARLAARVEPPPITVNPPFDYTQLPRTGPCRKCGCPTLRGQICDQCKREKK